MRPRRLFPTAPRGQRDPERPPATAARGSCSWPPGTSLPPSSPGRGGHGDGFWLRTKLLLPTGRAWGSTACVQPVVCFAPALGTDPVPTRGGASARGPGCGAMTWRRGASWGEATAALVLVGWGWGASGPARRPGSPLLHGDRSRSSPSRSLQERGGPEHAVPRWSLHGPGSARARCARRPACHGLARPATTELLAQTVPQKPTAAACGVSVWSV